MPSRPLFRSPLSVLVLAVLAAVAIGISSRSSSGSDPIPLLPPQCEGLSPAECQALMEGTAASGAAGTGSVILAAGEVCFDVGYLCAEVEASGSLRLLRWPQETTLIEVWIPEPSGVDRSLARELQNAAVRGIRAWHGHPIPLSIRTRIAGGEPDITIQWQRTVDDGRLGRAEVQWSRAGADVRVKVVGFAIATHAPGRNGIPLTPDQVALVAAHEMGHALGLPHSDDARDVMFPTNTATRLTSRDYRTLDALYSLPNGAEILK